MPWPNSPLAAGTTLRNPALADILRRIASQGSKALLTGPAAFAPGQFNTQRTTPTMTRMNSTVKMMPAMM